MKPIKTAALALVIIISGVYISNEMIINSDLLDQLAAAGDSSKKQVSPGTYTRALTHDGLSRLYTIHIPTGYTTKEEYPLVFLLHGGGGVGADVLTKTKLDAKADAEGFIVVAPNGVDRNWNDGRGTTARTETADSVTNTDDVDFIEKLIKEIQQDYAVDSDRMYVTGVSNGALMSQRLACDLPGVFAAIGPSSGPMVRNSIVGICDNVEPVAVVGFQGTEDPFFPIYDANGIPALPRLLARQGIEQTPLEIEEITEFWANNNKCSMTPNVEALPDVTGDGTVVTKYSFDDCIDGKDVVYYIVDGAGHGWPGNIEEDTARGDINGGGTTNLLATDAAWDFFASQTLAEEIVEEVLEEVVKEDKKPTGKSESVDESEQVVRGGLRERLQKLFNRN